jgi:hypothetical protein
VLTPGPAAEGSTYEHGHASLTTDSIRDVAQECASVLTPDAYMRDFKASTFATNGFVML